MTAAWRSAITLQSVVSSPLSSTEKTSCFPTPPKVLLQVPSRSASSRLPSQTISIPMPISPTSSPKLLKWLQTAKIGLKLCSRKMLRIPARPERRSAPKLDAYLKTSFNTCRFSRLRCLHQTFHRTRILRQVSFLSNGQE